MINSHITAAVAADRHRTLLAQARADSLAGQARSSRQHATGGTVQRARLRAVLGRLQSALSRTQLQPAISTEPNAAPAEPSIVAWSLLRSLDGIRLRAEAADANATAELLPNAESKPRTIERNEEILDFQASVCTAAC